MLANLSLILKPAIAATHLAQPAGRTIRLGILRDLSPGLPPDLG
jgi:hypothetical protein